jgi:rhodanese-related sulfurtransferase
MPTIFSRTERGEGYGTIAPAELAERMKRGEAVLLIDVREEDEYELARVEGARLMPLSRFPEWADSLNADDEMVFMCHHGIRSAHVCAFLAREGFTKLFNLAGGIDRWSNEVDPDVPQY